MKIIGSFEAPRAGGLSVDVAVSETGRVILCVDGEAFPLHAELAAKVGEAISRAAIEALNVAYAIQAQG